MPGEVYVCKLVERIVCFRVLVGVEIEVCRVKLLLFSGWLS